MIVFINCSKGEPRRETMEGELWLERVLQEVERKLNDEEYEVEPHLYNDNDKDKDKYVRSFLKVDEDEVEDVEENEDLDEEDGDGVLHETPSIGESENNPIEDTPFLDSLLTIFLLIIVGYFSFILFTSINSIP